MYPILYAGQGQDDFSDKGAAEKEPQKNAWTESASSVIQDKGFTKHPITLGP